MNTEGIMFWRLCSITGSLSAISFCAAVVLVIVCITCPSWGLLLAECMPCQGRACGAPLSECWYSWPSMALWVPPREPLPVEPYNSSTPASKSLRLIGITCLALAGLATGYSGCYGKAILGLGSSTVSTLAFICILLPTVVYWGSSSGEAPGE